MSDIDIATAWAISLAKRLGSSEITPDELLLGCLQAKSQFGVVQIGPVTLDLEKLGIDWLRHPEKPETKVAYSAGTVEVFDRAALIARVGGESKVGVDHLLAAYAADEGGLMGRLKEEYGITSAMWRAALAQSAQMSRKPAEAAESGAAEYLTPERAAEVLGIHVQTVRAYVRTGKLPALRLAGERAIRIRRSDLEKVFEPVVPETSP
jgi:excisionase family DNA binding protein